MLKKITTIIAYQVISFFLYCRAFFFLISFILLYVCRLANIVFGSQDGLDYWNQTKDYLEPILDKNGTYSMVDIFFLLLFLSIVSSKFQIYNHNKKKYYAL